MDIADLVPHTKCAATHLNAIVWMPLDTHHMTFSSFLTQKAQKPGNKYEKEPFPKNKNWGKRFKKTYYWECRIRKTKENSSALFCIINCSKQQQKKQSPPLWSKMSVGFV